MMHATDPLGVSRFITANDAMCNALAGAADSFRELAEKIVDIFIRLHGNRFYPKRKGGFHAARLNRMRIVKAHRRVKAR